MKILFLSHGFYPDVGGIEVNSEVLAREFTSAGHQVTVVTWSGDDAHKPFPFEVVRNPNIFQLLQLHWRADVIFENNPCLKLSWPSLILRKPIVVALRTWISRNDGRLAIQDKAKLRWLEWAQQVIAVSAAVRDRCYPKATVIGNPYRCKEFFSIPDTERNLEFVFLGRLVSDKGIDLAITALHKLIHSVNSSGRKFRLTIIGEGPERGNLVKLTQDLDLEEQVFFAGALRGDQLVGLLNRHRILLVPSRWEEPFGNVALEGMACGCVPIVSDGGGLPDAVGEAGLIFRRGDVNSLSAAMSAVVHDDDLASRIASKSAAHLSLHHPATVAKRYLDIIKLACPSK